MISKKLFQLGLVKKNFKQTNLDYCVKGKKPQGERTAPLPMGIKLFLPKPRPQTV